MFFLKNLARKGLNIYPHVYGIQWNWYQWVPIAQQKSWRVDETVTDASCYINIQYNTVSHPWVSARKM